MNQIIFSSEIIFQDIQLQQQLLYKVLKKSESASLTTMWTILGFPLTSVVIPVWLLDDGTMPKVLQADETGNAPLCNVALQVEG
ncbi:MAG: hypothetical protein MZV64_38135 [Ignavibacteriales bacterium]|nr:hypothetical protein [Ignavibacteriales bacterium]